MATAHVPAAPEDDRFGYGWAAAVRSKRRSGEIKKVMGDDVERLEPFLARNVPDLVVELIRGMPALSNRS